MRGAGSADRAFAIRLPRDHAVDYLVPTIRKLVNTNLTSVADPDWTIGTGDDDFHAAKGAARLAAAAKRPSITATAAAV